MSRGGLIEPKDLSRVYGLKEGLESMIGIGSVSISGTPAAGKSTIGRAISKHLNFPFLSTGDIMRDFAQEEGVSILEIGRLAQQDRSYDDKVDDRLRELSDSNRNVVIDSRMAWFFLKHSFSVHVVVDPLVAARRAESRLNQKSENYTSGGSAFAGVLQRAIADRERFKELYNVDIGRLRNYNLILDSTEASVEELVDVLLSEVRAFQGKAETRLWLDPTRLFPSEDIRVLRDVDEDAVRRISNIDFLKNNPVSIVYHDPHFVIVDGHKRLSAAIRSGVRLIPSVLELEGNEEASGVTAKRILEDTLANKSRLYDWESVHGINYHISSED